MKTCVISAVILGMISGCNTCVQGINGLAKDALIAAAAVKASTDGGLGRGPDTMELDHAPTISIDQARALAREYGISLEGGDR